MIEPEHLEVLWHQTRDRLVARDLLYDDGATLSVRCPGGTAMWSGEVAEAEPRLTDWSEIAAVVTTDVHAAVYAARPDVGAIAWGGGVFGFCLAGLGGALPQVFDEQARHIGPTPPVLERISELEPALREGGNVLLVKGVPMCLGTTCTRLALNLELFEKCAKAYVLAVAAGGRVKPLPWWVRRIANARLAKDQRRAAEAFARGELPEESRGY